MKRPGYHPYRLISSLTAKAHLYQYGLGRRSKEPLPPAANKSHHQSPSETQDGNRKRSVEPELYREKTDQCVGI